MRNTVQTGAPPARQETARRQIPVKAQFAFGFINLVIEPDLRRLGDAPDRFEQITPGEEVILLKAQRAGKTTGIGTAGTFAVAPVDASRGWLTHRGG
ncbi:hypothetical protein AU254_20910 [Yersinia pestis]|nr:hypothetical protein AU254_20910 [Yersinia pestis]